MKEIAEGRVYTGEEAKKIGLVDTFGNLSDAIEKAGRLGGIKGRIKTVFPERKGFSLLSLLLGTDIGKNLESLTLPYPEPAFLPPWFR